MAKRPACLAIKPQREAYTAVLSSQSTASKYPQCLPMDRQSKTIRPIILASEYSAAMSQQYLASP